MCRTWIFLLAAVLFFHSFSWGQNQQDVPIEKRKPYGQNPNDLGYKPKTPPKTPQEIRQEEKERYEARKDAEKQAEERKKQAKASKKEQPKTAKDVLKDAEQDAKSWLGWKALEVGDVGKVEAFRVVQIIDDDNALVEMRYYPYVALASEQKKLVLLHASTKNLADNDSFSASASEFVGEMWLGKVAKRVV